MLSMLARKLEEIRKAISPGSATAFAKMLGLNQPTYARYESGERKPTFELITQLITMFNVSPMWLFTGDGEMFNKPDNNTGERQNDTTIPEKVQRFGDRLGDLQDKHEFLDREMAQLLKISEKDYISLKLNKIEPDLDVLNRLKQCFKVSIDHYLYGE